MNVIGERIRILAASDPTMAGLTGLVLLESANTLTVESLGRTRRIAKSGLSLQLLGSGRVVSGLELAGRLQERLGKRSP